MFRFTINLPDEYRDAVTAHAKASTGEILDRALAAYGRQLVMRDLRANNITIPDPATMQAIATRALTRARQSRAKRH